MQRASSVIIHHLDYSLPNKQLVFSDLTLSLSGKTALIGRNGSGKSTLLKLIAGEIFPNAGSITVQGKCRYLPQNFVFSKNASIAEELGIHTKLAALRRIYTGSNNLEDFNILNEDWLIEQRAQEKLSKFNLSHIHLDRYVSSLSGGEATRLMLLKLFQSDADILLLDEPSNNLDISTKNLLMQCVTDWQGSLLIATHDRFLLNQLEQIIELNTLGTHRYGGNYQFYLQQKTIETAAIQRELVDAKKNMDKTRYSIQSSYETHDQRRAKGENARKTGKIDKLSANAARGRSERSQKRLATQEEQMFNNAQERLDTAKQKIEVFEKISIHLPNTFIANDKIIVIIKNFYFQYADSNQSLIRNFSLYIRGPERIALTGDNGSGKTTLIKLILGELQPTRGKIYVSVQKTSYLDQQVTLLDPKLSVLNNFLKLNPSVKEQNAYHALAQFLFRNIDALKLVENLSGGEKLRALLACVLMSNNPPQLLILDEPTNHLDLESICSIESALNCYQGALIIISHDESFLENIHIQRFIAAPFHES
jgi:ATPase subunit of ABC transporter with duplicated ATPase domains